MTKYDANSADSEDSGRPRPFRRPLPKVSQKCTKNRTQNKTHFFIKNASQGTPKILKHRNKSIRAPLQNPPESPSRRNREKSGSRTLPETSPCASRTVNTMVLARFTKCFQTICFINLGFISTPFLALRAPTNHSGAENCVQTKT